MTEEEIKSLQEANEANSKELEELRQFKTQKEQEEKFQSLVKEIKPLYSANNGRKGHEERFVKEYQSQLEKEKDIESFIKTQSKNDNLFFESPKAVNTSQIFKNDNPNSQTQQTTKKTDNVDDYFMKNSTLRKR